MSCCPNSMPLALQGPNQFLSCSPRSRANRRFRPHRPSPPTAALASAPNKERKSDILSTNSRKILRRASKRGKGGKRGREEEGSAAEKKKSHSVREVLSLNYSACPFNLLMARLQRVPAQTLVYIMGHAVNMMYESTERLEQGNVLNIRSRTGGGLGINKL